MTSSRPARSVARRLLAIVSTLLFVSGFLPLCCLAGLYHAGGLDPAAGSGHGHMGRTDAAGTSGAARVAGSLTAEGCAWSRAGPQLGDPAGSPATHTALSSVYYPGSATRLFFDDLGRSCLPSARRRTPTWLGAAPETPPPRAL
jgi:hypothetical protein